MHKAPEYPIFQGRAPSSLCSRILTTTVTWKGRSIKADDGQQRSWYIRDQWNHRERVHTRKEYIIESNIDAIKKQTNKIITPGGLRAMCPDAKIRGISLGWVNGNSFTFQKIMAKTTAMPVIGDHTLFCKI